MTQIQIQQTIINKYTETIFLIGKKKKRETFNLQVKNINERK